ncbi:MAG: flagellar hook basal-body protein [Planctomycetota bacterium]|nr:MAG: flagellar hook basal-body protein [Planctomycetota bacterium]
MPFEVERLGNPFSVLERKMYQGLDIASSGVLTALGRLDALANNLANIDTPGYKPVQAITMQRDPARVEDDLPFLPSNRLLEKLGAGVLLAPSRASFAQGPVEVTGNDLDLAIEGDGFFVIRGASDGSTDQLLLSRDGRLTLDGRGMLVQAASGRPVLDTQNRAVYLRPDETVEIDGQGVIRQNGAAVAQLQLVDIADRAGLRHVGDSLFSLGHADTSNLFAAGGRVIQRAIEGSAVNEVSALLEVQGASRAVGSNINVMAYQDRMIERAINTFARIG